MAETAQGSFEGVIAKAWKGEQLYRVMVTSERLGCVWQGGGMSVNGGQAIWVHLGLLGALIGYFVQKSQAKKRAAALPALEATPLDELLARDPKSFELRLAGLDSAALRKPGFFQGKYAALLELKVSGEEKPRTVSLLGRDQATQAARLLRAQLRERITLDPKLKWLSV